MSESKHTRGPWRTHIADSTLIVDADGNEIARTLGDYDTEYEAMETRATFIKAAPDLYAALARMTALVEAGGDPLSEPNRPTYEAARAALAAARGEL